MKKILAKEEAPPSAQQNQLAEAFRNFQHCVQHCEKAVFFTDGAGILQRVNPSFEKLTGYSAAESVGKDLSWMAAQGPACEEYRKIWKDIFDSRSFRGPLQVRRRDGSCLQLQLTAVAVRDTRGQITNLVLTGQNIAATEAPQSEVLAADVALGGSLFHEFTNTLMVLGAYAELGANRLSSDNPLWSDLQQIRTAAQRACELGRDMLRLIAPRRDASKVESSRGHAESDGNAVRKLSPGRHSRPLKLC